MNPHNFPKQALIFILLGLLILPYVFGAELWPNHLRSFGASFSQLFHWIFYFALNKGMPGLLENTNNWGAFLFFAGWCFVSILYTFFVVPETAGQNLESIDALFEQPIWQAYRTTKVKKPQHDVESREISSVPA